MKSKLLLTCTILFFCSSFLCGQNQSSKVANSVETNNGCIRHPWQGKRVGYLGDSITDPNCYGDKIKKYWDFLQEWLGITPYVYGISGRQWNDVPRQAEQLKKEHGGEVDAIVILMGTNDFNDGVPIGEWFTETEEQVMAARGQTQKLEIRKKRTPIMDGSTYKGRINIGINRLKQLFPDKQIVLLTPLHRSLANFGETNVQPDENYQNSCGDYVVKLNGTEVADKDDLITRIENGSGEAAILTIRRGEEYFDVKIDPVQDQTKKYKIGVWVRDNAQGVGTMTYIDSQGNFGALGHGINDVDTSNLMEMNDGTLYQTEIISIQKGTAGHPGEMTGMIVYSDDRILGDITSNSVRGIFGKCNDKALALGTEEAMPIGLKQEIRKGPAQILCTVDGTTRYYDIEITDIHLDHDNVNRGIELKVTDSDLIALTGGIVQGMSGAPIIQNGKFVGAVTHVLVQDSTRGYGIFIENMLEQ